MAGSGTGLEARHTWRPGRPRSLASSPDPSLSSGRPEVVAPLPSCSSIPPLPVQANQPSRKGGRLCRDGRPDSRRPCCTLAPEAGPRVDRHALCGPTVPRPVSTWGTRGRAGWGTLTNPTPQGSPQYPALGRCGRKARRAAAAGGPRCLLSLQRHWQRHGERLLQRLLSLAEEGRCERT